MNKEHCIFLIETYKEYQTLWDPKDKNYYNNTIREHCWKKISSILDKPVTKIKAKMKSLMRTYRREKSRHKQSLITGSGRNTAHESKWFAYEYFTFLSDRDNPGQIEHNGDKLSHRSQTVDTLTEDPNALIDTTDDSLSTTKGVTDHISGPNSTENKRNLHCVRVLDNIAKKKRHTKSKKKRTKSKKRRTKSKIASEGDMLKTAFSVLQKSTDVNVDPYFTYGQYIANELRKYDSHTLIIVKRVINNIIYNADLGRINSLQSNLPTTCLSPAPSVAETVVQDQQNAQVIKDDLDIS